MKHFNLKEREELKQRIKELRAINKMATNAIKKLNKCEIENKDKIIINIENTACKKNKYHRRCCKTKR